MAAKQLNSRKVDTIGPGRHPDGDGLYLVVTASLTRSWQARYTYGGRRQWMGLGPAKGSNLAQARKDNEKWQDLARLGKDPKAAREAERLAVQSVPSFTSCAAAFIRAHRRGWRNRKHGRQWVATLKTYARPIIGTKPIDQIGTEDVLKILSPVWLTRNETASRLRGRLENILDYAAARKWRDPLNPARWRGHLDKLLPKPAKVQSGDHHPAMPYTDVPAFMQRLRDQPSLSSSALQFLILTAARTNEVLGAQWSEIDLDNKVWTIPGGRQGRMKGGREHRVPLAPQAIALLEALPRVAGNPYLFPGARAGRPLSNMALLQLMRGMGHGVGGTLSSAVPHGFRSSFRDWSGEVSSFPRDVCEMALAHAIANKVEAAYRRGDLFEKRRLLMESWANYCTAVGAKVVSLDARRAA